MNAHINASIIIINDIMSMIGKLFYVLVLKAYFNAYACKLVLYLNAGHSALWQSILTI